MTRMLMAAAYEEAHCSPRHGCTEEPKYSRTAQRLRERLRWQRDFEDERSIQAGEDERPIGYVERWPMAEAPRDPLLDKSDCRHGCNGDCIVSSSEVCTITCHPAGALL
jgi:hypothetical protein